MTATLRLRFEPRAADEIVEIDAWWRANRDAASLFAEELAAALDLVLVTPSLGTAALDPAFAGVRRFLLRKTRYHLYYRVSDDALHVLAVWHAMREPPTL